MTSEWQDIATAPKDGTEVLLFWNDRTGHGITVGKWSTDPYSRYPQPFWDTDRGIRHGKRWSREVYVTHWMPLPAPPEPDDGDEEPDDDPNRTDLYTENGEAGA